MEGKGDSLTVRSAMTPPRTASRLTVTPSLHTSVKQITSELLFLWVVNRYFSCP